jgi:hypothetical protein
MRLSVIKKMSDEEIKTKRKFYGRIVMRSNVKKRIFKKSANNWMQLVAETGWRKEEKKLETYINGENSLLKGIKL